MLRWLPGDVGKLDRTTPQHPDATVLALPRGEVAYGLPPRFGLFVVSGTN